MKKKLTLLFSLAFIIGSKAQYVADFEGVTLDSGKVLNGMNGDTTFLFTVGAGTLKMPVKYDTSFGGYWASGWAISRKIDSTTQASSFSKHLYCAKPGLGVTGSKTFAVGQDGTWFTYSHATQGIGQFSITNTTYAYNSMLLGDAFAKKFGGASGNDADYFFVRIRSYKSGVFKDSQDVYLADFRNSDNSKDYILKTWKTVTLNPANTDSVAFEMFSSDTSQWGFNTPGFFAIDNVEVFDLGVQNRELTQWNFYPNPANDKIMVTAKERIISAQILSLDGKTMLKQTVGFEQGTIQLNTLSAGVYMLQIETSGGISSKKIIVSHL